MPNSLRCWYRLAAVAAAGAMAASIFVWLPLGRLGSQRAFEISAAAFAAAFGILLCQVQRVREARGIAEKAISAKSEFLANMSHEIRTPLNGIVAMTEMLSRSGLRPEQREMADVVLTSADSLLSIVNDILDFSKIEAGNLAVEQVAYDLRACVEGVARQFEPRARQKNLTLICQIAPAVPEAIYGDPLRVRQVLVHLVSNAIKFTREGAVRVEVEAAGDPAAGPAVLVRVTDTGIGIDPAASSSLFHAFYQADSATTRKYGGTGLGLAIALRLVTLMGGSIGVEPNREQGSVFWFVIPARSVAPKPAEDPPPAPSQQDAAPAVRRILVVEDNPVNQMVASRALTTLGYQADVVDGGEKALEALHQRHFDLILMDCQMPGMDGYEATMAIRRREGGKSRVPIVAMTANMVVGNRELCLAAGMDDYLSKPIRLATLGKTLDCWLRAKPAAASN